VQTRGARVLLLLVTPDAVVRLVERADEIGARVGQRETFAPPGVTLAQSEAVHAVARLALDGNQPHVVELARRLEQYAGLVQCLAFRRMRGPRRVTEREIDVIGVRRVCTLGFPCSRPLADSQCERQLAALRGP